MATDTQIICTNTTKQKQVKPVRVLHLLGGLERGGIETWLMHLLRRTDRRHFEMDFLVRGAAKGEYENEAEELGSGIGRSLHHRHPFKFAAELRAFIASNGPYDIFHSHLAEYDGLIMWLASRLGVKVRISHSHNDTRCIDVKAPMHRHAYLNIGRRLIKAYSTHCLAASQAAAMSQFGNSWTSDPRVRTLYCGIDLTPFAQANNIDRWELRKHLGIPAGAFVIGHVGRFVKQKNHAFLVQIFAALARIDPAVHLMMVGSGPLIEDVTSLVSRAGLESRVTILKPRPDIPKLMVEAMDVFVFPSLHEGLGLVLLEAQAAGLPCVASDAIPAEASAVPGGIEFLSLTIPAEQWADKVHSYKVAAQRPTTEVSRLSGGPFDIRVSAASLFELYSQAAYSRLAT